MFHVEVDWSFGVNSILVELVEHFDIPVDHIKVVNEDEIIIHNNPVR